MIITLLIPLILSIIIPIYCTDHSTAKSPIQKTTTSDRFNRNDPFNVENIINDAKDECTNMKTLSQADTTNDQRATKVMVPIIVICKSNNETSTKVMLHIINIENNEVVYPGNKKAFYLFMVKCLAHLLLHSGWINVDRPNSGR